MPLASVKGVFRHPWDDRAGIHVEHGSAYFAGETTTGYVVPFCFPFTAVRRTSLKKTPTCDNTKLELILFEALFALFHLVFRSTRLSRAPTGFPTSKRRGSKRTLHLHLKLIVRCSVHDRYCVGSQVQPRFFFVIE